MHTRTSVQKIVSILLARVGFLELPDLLPAVWAKVSVRLAVDATAKKKQTKEIVIPTAHAITCSSCIGFLRATATQKGIARLLHSGHDLSLYKKKKNRYHRDRHKCVLKRA